MKRFREEKEEYKERYKMRMGKKGDIGNKTCIQIGLGIR